MVFKSANGVMQYLVLYVWKCESTVWMLGIANVQYGADDAADVDDDADADVADVDDGADVITAPS